MRPYLRETPLSCIGICPQQGLAVAKERIERQKNELLFGKDRYIGR